MKTTTKFDLYLDIVDFRISERKVTVEDVKDAFYGRRVCEPQLLASCETLDEARAKFKNFKSGLVTKITDSRGQLRAVSEFLYIEENVYDEDGDFVRSNGVWDEYAAEIREEDEE